MAGTPIDSRSFDRRTKSVIALLTAFVLVTLTTVRIADLVWRRAQTVGGAAHSAGNLAFILSEYLREAFTGGDASLRQLAATAQRLGGAAAPAAEWTPVLESARTALGGVGSISVTDADGIIRHSTVKSIVGQSRRDQFIFRQLSTTAGDDLVVDTPFLTVTEPRAYVIPIGRRITTAAGGFDGMIVATIIPSQFRSFFRTVDVGRGGSIWVFHPDGLVLFREPSIGNPIGQRAADNPIFTAAQARRGAGTIEGPVEPGGAPLISAFHAAPAPALIAAVSLDRAEVLAEWRRDVQISAAFLLVLWLTGATSVIVLFRQIDRRARAERALIEAQRVESVRLREAHDRLEAALAAERRAQRETEAASYLKDEFLMTVSHELRTPLTAIYGWARMLLTARLDEDRTRRAVATIERNARAQTQLIDDLLDVSRIISGKLRLDVRAVNPADALHAAAEALKPAADAKRIDVETNVDPRAGLVMGDPDRLQQIVWNLLSNAIKFTPAGGRIDLQLMRAGAHVDIAVRDTGAGISADFLPYVFERFRQEESGTRRRYSGLGLGLAIVRHLVELHGGSIEAESPGEGLGATFRVRLPLSAAAPASADAPLETPHDASRSGGAARRLDARRVLVVDDQTETRALFAAILSAAGATVDAVESAREAIARLETARWDVLMSAIETPGEDGSALVQRARAIAAARGDRLIAIAVTAHAREQDRRRVLDAGFDRHVAKPVDPAELVALVAALVNV